MNVDTSQYVREHSAWVDRQRTKYRREARSLSDSELANVLSHQAQDSWHDKVKWQAYTSEAAYRLERSEPVVCYPAA